MSCTWLCSSGYPFQVNFCEGSKICVQIHFFAGGCSVVQAPFIEKVISVFHCWTFVGSSTTFHAFCSLLVHTCHWHIPIFGSQKLVKKKLLKRKQVQQSYFLNINLFSFLRFLCGSCLGTQRSLIVLVITNNFFQHNRIFSCCYIQCLELYKYFLSGRIKNIQKITEKKI